MAKSSKTPNARPVRRASPAPTPASARWILRRHHLQEDPTTLRILREYIRSAWSIGARFGKLLDEVKPAAVVVFNGMQYPEASARWVARQKGLPVYSHEVGLRPMSAFFTEGDATAYPLVIPQGFELDDAQNNRLDAYLQNRFKGNFIMAGVRFWPEMSALDPEFLALAAHFKQVVPVFTNVIFDTSQPHANVLFEDMFTWLDDVLAYLEDNRDYVAEFVRQRLPGISMVKPEGGYLAWLDCRRLKLPEAPFDFFLHQARVALMPGPAYGRGGEGFLRLNFGCTRATLTAALERMERALAGVAQ